MSFPRAPRFPVMRKNDIRASPADNNLVEKTSSSCLCEQMRKPKKIYVEERCAICIELVAQKPSGHKKFGILPNCDHCYCLGCIRRWRKSKEYNDNSKRACPKCMLKSDFVLPSKRWFHCKKEKDQAISQFKKAAAEKACRRFRGGYGRCSYGSSCFYRHEISNEISNEEFCSCSMCLYDL